MANAKKCDRCGKFYRLEDKNFKTTSSRVVMAARLLDRSGYSLNDYDLCDDCAAALYDFLTNYEAEGQL